ncbi:hypothetical protein CVT24_013147 [Panaeolus cyanescens]|uniref:Uncharacterized protein n=1 Tax=Panaeolus cyanescens TaxID=181874 RepID=A0A409WR12_9AGAR|nr:hypothetical protein CVT24_013147 [Panaeolus cyanescens]
MPGITISRPRAPLLSKMKIAFSLRTKAPKDTSVVPILAQAVQVDSPSEAGSEPCEPPRTVVPLPSHIIPLETPSAFLQTSSTTGAPLTINDLPPEILAEIFHTYMFWDDQSDLLDPELEGMISVFLPNAQSAPLLFCRVCSYWRDVAISTPSLWSAIAIQKSFNLDTIALWLKRSQGHPLSLFIWLFRDASSTVLEHLPLLLQMLYAQIARWRQISIYLPTSELMQSFLCTLIPTEGNSPAVQLEHLHISREYREGPLGNPESLARLSSFPHPTLRRITWDGGFFTPDFSHMPVTLWANLQQMSLARATTNNLLAFLTATPDFNEAEARRMLQTSIFTTIPHFSLRLLEEVCDPSFPQAIISETAGAWKDTAYAHHEPQNYSHHMGWGTLDLARTYHVDYPFLVKGGNPVILWSVSLTDGPSTNV